MVLTLSFVSIVAIVDNSSCPDEYKPGIGLKVGDGPTYCFLNGIIRSIGCGQRYRLLRHLPQVAPLRRGKIESENKPFLSSSLWKWSKIIGSEGVILPYMAIYLCPPPRTMNIQIYIIFTVLSFFQSKENTSKFSTFIYQCSLYT